MPIYICVSLLVIHRPNCDKSNKASRYNVKMTTVNNFSLYPFSWVLVHAHIF